MLSHIILFGFGLLSITAVQAASSVSTSEVSASNKTTVLSTTVMSTNVDSSWVGNGYFFGNSDRPIWVGADQSEGPANGAQTYSNIFPNDTSRFLYLRDFGFNIPCNAIIDSISVDIIKRNNSTVDVVDAHVTLFNPYTLSLGGINMADTTTPWLEGGSWETVNYTHPTWGEMLTTDMINNNRFGLIVAARNILSAGRSEAYIDAVKMRVYYTVTSAPSSPISFDVDKTDACYDEGSITVTAIGGLGSYEYSINGGASWQSSNTFTGLAQGDYTIIVRNSDMTCQTAPINCNLSGDERILQPGDGVVTCATYPGNNVTMGVEKLQPMNELYVAGETGYDISSVIGPHSFKWTTSDLGGEVFSVAIDPERHIYTATTIMYDLSPGGSIAVYVSRIDALTGAVMFLDTLPGDAGAAGVEYQDGCDQLFVANLSDGTIYRMHPETGDVLSTFDPLAPDNGAPLIAPLGQRVLAMAYNQSDGRLYYSMWNSDFNRTGIRNTIRSIAIDPGTCDFLPGTDQEEIQLPWTSEYGDLGNADDFSMPVADMEFSADGTTLIMSESGFDSTVPNTKAHSARVLRYIGTSTNWTLQTALPPGNTNIQHEFGEVSAGLNARGGIAFSNSGFDGTNCAISDEQFIVGSADALRGADCNTLGCIYGLQYMPVTGGRPINSVLLDVGRNLDTQQKSIFGDIDIVSGCPTPLSCCPDLSSNEPDVVLCPGETLGTFTATTQADSLKLVYHTTIPADSAAVYTDGIPFDTVQVVGGSATLSLDGLDVSTPITYYVYVVTHPTSDLEYCRPYDSIVVNVRNLPTVTIDDPTDRCIVSTDMRFTGTPTPGGGATGTFTSDAPGGLTDHGDGTATLDISVAGAGTYNVDYNFTDSFGCSNSASTSVTVYDQPTVTINDPGDICVDGSPLLFTGSPLPSSGISGVFTTDAPGGLTDNGDGTASLDPALAGVGSYTMTYTYTDINGCVGFASIGFDVNALPSVTINDPSDECVTAGTISFTGGPFPGGGTTGVFSTTAPAGLTDNNDGTANLDLSASGDGVFDVTYTYTDINGCISSDVTTFEVFPELPDVFFNTGFVCGDPTFGSNVIDLNTLITSGPLGGTWADTDGTGRLSGSTFTADPSMEGSSYNFTYTITGPGPAGTTCQTRSFVATVNVGYCYLDLALIKSTSQVTPVLAGDLVQFDITVCNQGFIPVDSIEITDYLAPCYGFVPNNGWVANGPNASITLTVANGGLPGAGLLPVNFSPNNCITVPLELTISCGVPDDLVAYAEITAGRDTAGNTDDFDSTPGSNSLAENSVLPGSAEDDSFTDAFEDDHDPGVMPLADIALRNTIVSVPPFNYGDPVRFRIELINQGNIDLYNIEVTDYIPCGFAYNPSNSPLWSPSGGNATTVVSQLNVGQTTTVDILLDIQESPALCDNATSWLNEAEVSDINRLGPVNINTRDFDSNIDGIQGNDAGGAPASASDDVISGDGTDIIGGSNPLGDEDDHDPALFNLYDLAIAKIETSTGPYGQDSIVTYELTISNQGGIDANNIVIQDYPELGLQYNFSDASGNPNVNETGVLEWTILSLSAGSSETINLNFSVASGFQSLNVANRVQITSDDGDDIDSNPLTDWTVDEDGDFNPYDDDEDIVSINIAQYYDLSIQKSEVSVGPYQQGSVITYDIAITNEGTLNASNILIQEDPEAGLIFVSDNSASNPNVTSLGGGSYQIANLPFGTSENFEIVYSIDNNYQPTSIYNRVRITQDDGDDIDSDPSTSYTVDEDGDFDPFDDDEAEIVLDVEQIYDLRIDKTEFSGGPYFPGDNITFNVLVSNEGTLHANNITFQDIADPALSFVSDNSASNPNVSLVGPLTYQVGTLNKDASTSINITFQVDGVFQGDTVTNLALITVDDGDDIDSDPDLDETADEDGDFDPFDDDESLVEVEISQIYDLSISKTLLTTGDIYPGDDISFRIDIVNEGTLNAANVIVSEFPDAGLNYVSNTTGLDPNIVELSPSSFQILALDAYTSTSFEITYNVDPAYVNAIINNIVAITVDDGDDIDSDPDLDFTVDEDGDLDPFDDDEDIAQVALYVGFTIGDYVWHDLNGNGIQDFNEPGIEGIKVEIYNHRDLLVGRTFTDINGFYNFVEVLPGDYYLQFDLGEDYFPTRDLIGANRNIDSDITDENGIGTTDLISLDTENLSIDGGLVQCAYIGGTVWFDYDKDNIMDPTENGINGLRVELYKLEPYGWTLWKSMITGHNEDTPSDDGYYKFCTEPGQYYLRFVNPPETLVPVAPNRGPEDIDSDVTGFNGYGTTNDIIVQSGDDRCDIGAGYYIMGTIGDYIWHDSNGNGMREAGESGMSGVVVNAINEAGTIVATTESDEEGRYMLDYLGEDDYYIQIIQPVGFAFSTPNVGSDDTMDSDIDGTNGYGTSRFYPVESGVHTPNVDVGLVYAVLPVEWVDVWGEQMGSYNQLDWLVSSEINVEKYIIERSVGNSFEFETIGEIPFEYSSSDVNAYSFKDFDIDGISEFANYRVKQIDYDGKFSFSKIVSIRMQANTKESLSFVMHPNPMTDFTILRMDGFSGGLKLSLYDINGRILLEKNIDEIEETQLREGRYRFDIPNLRSGTYLLKMTDAYQSVSKKLIILD